MAFFVKGKKFCGGGLRPKLPRPWGETLKTYSDKYWEMFNEIDENFDDVAIRTFNVGLPAKHDLRKSLTRKPVRSVCQLMNRIDEYK